MSPNRVSLLYITSEVIGAAMRSARRLCRPNSRPGRPGRLPLLKMPCIVLLFLTTVLRGPNVFGQQRPNILLILPDQLRAAGIGCMGNSDVRTPYIDQLAREGMLFRRTYANVPVCCPARATL